MTALERRWGESTEEGKERRHLKAVSTAKAEGSTCLEGKRSHDPLLKKKYRSALLALETSMEGIERRKAMVSG